MCSRSNSGTSTVCARGVDPRPYRGEPLAGRARSRAVGIAAEHGVRLVPQVRDHVARDLLRGGAVELRRDARRVQDGDVGERAGRQRRSRRPRRAGPGCPPARRARRRRLRRRPRPSRGEPARRRGAGARASRRARAGSRRRGRAPPRTATFVANSVVCGAISTTASRPIPIAYARRPGPVRGIVRGSVIMKKRKTRISGEKTSDAPELPAGDRPEVPARRHLVAARREHGEARGEGEPEADRDLEQLQPAEDREPADGDEHERERERRAHRPPPEVERVGALRPEQQEAEDEAEVRRIEDVRAAELDHVLREQRHGRGAREDPPAVHAPPVAVLGARDAEDERDAVPRQERARRPHQHVLAAERDRDLEHRARQHRDEDLRDREVEVEGRLPQDLQRDDHGREVQARVAHRREQHRVRRAADADRRPASVDDGGRTHCVRC